MHRAIGRDEDTFSDVNDFKPERFLSEKGMLKDGPPLSANPIFGLGRRICEPIPSCRSSPFTFSSGPGRFASEAIMWTAVVSVLATFRIIKAKDANGKEIDVKGQFTTGLAVCVIMNVFIAIEIDVALFFFQPAHQVPMLVHESFQRKSANDP